MSAAASGSATTRLFEAVSSLCRNLAILLLALMSVLIIAQVLGRNLFDTGMPWADELARFCGVALVFLCVPLLALRGSLVAVDMVPMVLPPAPKYVFTLFSEFTVLVFAAISLWALYAFLGRAWKFATPTLGIPNWIFYAPSLIAFALLALITVLRIVTLLRGRRVEHKEGFSA
jgi:TRAP-type transport system small permease protein